MKKIEFLGMPRAGKSTQIELLESMLKHEKSLSVRSLSEGARISPLDKGNSFLFNAWSFNNMANRIMEYSVHPIDYLIIDRGIYDHIAFADAFYRSDKMSRTEYLSQKNYFKQFIGLEDSIVLFNLSAEESLKREHTLHSYTGRVMNQKFLVNLEEAYKEMVVHIQIDFRDDSLIIDSSKELQDNKKLISEFVLSRKEDFDCFFSR